MARATDKTRLVWLGVAVALCVSACSGPVTAPPPRQGGGTVSAAAVSSPATADPATESGPPPSATTPAAAAAPTTAPVSPASPSPAPVPVAVPTGCPVPAALAGQDVERIATDRKVIALTFDGGANAESVEEILATLDREQVPATFFVTGDFATRFPEQTRALAARGPVGNHTQTHPDLTKVGAAAGGQELDQASAAISAATGKSTVPYFRFPFGARNQAAITLVNERCFVPFRWTTDSLGWKGTSGGQSAQRVQERVVSDLEPGGIVLMHLGSNPDDGSTLDSDALPGIIAGARAQGYTFVTLEAAFAS